MVRRSSAQNRREAGFWLGRGDTSRNKQHKDASLRGSDLSESTILRGRLCSRTSICTQLKAVSGGMQEQLQESVDRSLTFLWTQEKLTPSAILRSVRVRPLRLSWTHHGQLKKDTLRREGDRGSASRT